MSLAPVEIPRVPEETVRVARAAFPKGNVYMHMRDALGTVYNDSDFAELFPAVGQPAESPWRLALVLVMQFAENLSDRQAADAVRGRIDWKYALSLPLTDAGFNYSVLTEFRARLLAGGAETRLLDKFLELFQARGWLKSRGRQRTDATYVVAAVQRLNRVELVAITLQYTLDEIARVAPDWLRERTPGEWFTRYSKRLDDYRLPRKEPERQQMAEQVGADGQPLLQWLDQAATPEALRELEVVSTLRRIWAQQFDLSSTHPRFRTQDALPSSELEVSPLDAEARFRTKRHFDWIGYQVHFTETCDEHLPHVVVHVETTPATDTEYAALPDIHRALERQQLLPAQQVVDGGYSSSDMIADSHEFFNIDLLCPAPRNQSWQARNPDAFDVTRFQVDYAKGQVICPMHKVSVRWKARPAPKSPHKTVFVAHFAVEDCTPCPARSLCTRSKEPHTITVLPERDAMTLQQARQRQQSPDFLPQYNIRAGIEGTLSQAVRRSGLHRSRYLGLDKTHLQLVLTATALNLVRIMNWITARPRAGTRHSPFSALAA